jgi:transcriptional regulator with XRE-family HTH domain
LVQRRSRHIHPVSGPEKAFGLALREIRRERDVSQEQLGFDAGLDRTYISLIERGVQSPTVRTVVRLADALEVAPSEMIRRMESVLAADRAGRVPRVARKERTPKRN